MPNFFELEIVKTGSQFSHIVMCYTRMDARRVQDYWKSRGFRVNMVYYFVKSDEMRIGEKA